MAWGSTTDWWKGQGGAGKWTVTPRQQIEGWLSTAITPEYDWSQGGAVQNWAAAAQTPSEQAWQQLWSEYSKQFPAGFGTWNERDLRNYFNTAWRNYTTQQAQAAGQTWRTPAPLPTAPAPVVTPTIPTTPPTTVAPITTPPPTTEIPAISPQETPQAAVDWWQQEGFDTYQDWYGARVQPFNDMMLQVLEQRPTTDLSQLPYGDIGSLLEEAKTLGGGQWEEQAESSEARQMGFFDAEGNPDVAGLRAWKQQGRTPEGLSPEREATMRREQALSEQTAQESARKMAEAAYGASGGMIAKMQEAYDEANRAIVDDRLRFEIETANEDFMAQMAQGERYDRMLAQGQIAYQDYLTMKQQMVGTALQGYFQQANLMLETYQTEWNAIGQQAQMVIDAASLSMGTDEHVLNMTRQTFEAMLEPYLSQLGFENLEAMNEAIRQGTLDANLGVFVDFINVIANVIGAAA